MNKIPGTVPMSDIEEGLKTVGLSNCWTKMGWGRQKKDGPTGAASKGPVGWGVSANIMPGRKNRCKRERFDSRTQVSPDSPDPFDRVDKFPGVWAKPGVTRCRTREGKGFHSSGSELRCYIVAKRKDIGGRIERKIITERVKVGGRGRIRKFLSVTGSNAV